VIKKPHGQGGHSPCWAAEPEKINNNDAFYKQQSYSIREMYLYTTKMFSVVKRNI
jgi:hypothetical protein